MVEDESSGGRSVSETADAEGVQKVVDGSIEGISAGTSEGIPAGTSDVGRQLEVQEAWFRALVDHSVDCFLACEPDSTITYASPAARAIFGRHPDELVGTSAFDLVHPDDRAEALEQLTTARAKPGAPQSIELRAAHADGTWRWVQATTTDLRDDAHLSGFLCTVHDVTDRRRAEAAERERAALREAFLAASPDVQGMVAGDGTISFVSAAAETVLGFRPDELVGRPAFDLVHPDDIDLAAERFSGNMDGTPLGTPLTVRVRHADGRWLSVEGLGRTWYRDGEAAGIVFIIRDVSARLDAERALRQSEARLRAVLASSFDVTGTIRATSELLWVTPSIRDLLGYEPDELDGTSGFDLIHPLDRPAAARELARIVEGAERAGPVTLRARHKDGSWRHVEVAGSRLHDQQELDPAAAGGDAGEAGVGDGDDGANDVLVLTLRDVEDRIEGERERARLSALAEASHDLIAVVDRSGRLTYLNRAAREFFDVGMVGERGDDGRAGLRDLDIASLWGTFTEHAPVEELMDALSGAGSWRGEFALMRAGGEMVPVTAHFLTHRDESGRPEFYSAVIRDRSDRAAFENRLHHAATHDSLTDLPNRAALFSALGREMEGGEASAAVLFVDLDDFKLVNDALGHTLGDQALEVVARRLLEAVRPGDTVARFGGDEFVVLCPSVSVDAAERVAERILEVLGSPAKVAGHLLSLHGSIGIAVADGAANAQELIGRADTAMYEAKRLGKGRIHLWSS